VLTLTRLASRIALLDLLRFPDAITVAQKAISKYNLFVMDITWYGQTCFRIAEQDIVAVVTDPHPPSIGRALPRLHAGIVTLSREDPQCCYTEAVKGSTRVINGPGEYEIGGVFVTGITTFADSKKGSLRGLNTVFSFSFDGLTVCHLGRLGHVPAQSRVERLGTVDILLVPVGDGESLTPAQASEVISLFEPGLVVPMYYQIPGLEDDSLGPLNLFLKEMGIEKVPRHPSLEVARTNLPGETEIVVLKPAQ
jgi:L-ascorbate metabolism protein UlaG (beta-lactamase superfamily)